MCIQEPCFDWRDTTRSTQKWSVVYPRGHNNKTKRTRSIILVNATIRTTSWKALPVDSVDMAGVQMSGDYGAIRVFSIYNNQENNDSMSAVDAYLKDPKALRSSATSPVHDIWIGDFNRHSPLWDNPRDDQLFTAEANRKAERLITLAANWEMQMALPAGVPTLEHTTSKNWTRPDNIWVDEALKAHIIKCNVLEKERPVFTDHLPFMLELDTSPDRAEETIRWDWRGVDWDEFKKYVEDGMKELPDREIKEIPDFERELAELNDLLTKARDIYAPKVKASSYIRCWWSNELGKEQKRVAKLAQKAYAEGKRGCISHDIHEEHRKACNEYSQMIKLAKREHFFDWLERADPSTIWDIHKMIAAPASDGGKARVPTLKTLDAEGEIIKVDDDEEKAKLLHATFFPPAPANPQAPEDAVYPEPCMELQELSEEQVDRAIRKMKPYKAAGNDGLSNSIFTHCRECLVKKLTKLFRATFALKHYPKEWQESLTIMLRKDGKPDYSKTKAYRPITLLAAIAKILSSAMAELLSYMVEKFGLLPANSFGGCPGRSCADSLMLNVD